MKRLVDLPKTYDAQAVEDRIYADWEASGAFNPDTLPDRNQKGEPYSIMMPPPNVTGVLHLGHALENALMDTAARFQRMRGKRVLLVPGTDHAAIATQARVEKNLMKEGMKNPRQELGREKLLEKIREFAEQSKATILSQVRKMGTSCDWSRLAYTFDETRNTAVKELFCRMYKDGLIYRGYRVVNWSVKGQSTCSDDEIEHVERPSKLYTFKYSADFPITIATTRPETKLGDTAVAVHPTDKRYKKLIGQTFTVDVGAAKPLQIKIIADDGVDPKFGTGALGVTPAHSAVDFAMYEKQKAKGEPIEIIPVIDGNGKMAAEAGSAYAGLSVEEAREKFVTWLKEQNLLVQEEEIVQTVGTSERYGDVIEAIPMTQWWLDVSKTIPSRGKSLRDLMREAVTTGLNGDTEQKVTINPERFTKLYLDRIENLRDWCLSRQLWWGHRIPVWYRGEEMHVGTEAPQGEGWEQDPDTLDTWFSSGSWTFSTLGWPEKTKDLAAFHPTSWIQMGYEILYLWLMRMILMSSYALEVVPFKDAYIHGILRNEKGEKFSKSANNGIDPIEVIKTYGCDALRVSLLMGVSPGNDSRFYNEKIESGRNFVNKLWNISRFILTTIGTDSDSSSEVSSETLADRWILARLSATVASVTQKLETYQFSAAAEELRDFTWGDLADWYLEIAKVEKGKSQILEQILKAVLAMWHPFMPFVTEEIWQQAGFEGKLIVGEWPISDRVMHLTDSQREELKSLLKDAGQFPEGMKEDELVYLKDGYQSFWLKMEADSNIQPALKERFRSVRDRWISLDDFTVLRQLVSDMRRLRAELGVEAAKQIVFHIVTDVTMKKLIDSNSAWIKRLVNASELQFQDMMPHGYAATASGTMVVGIDLAGAIDITKERQKVEKELAQLSSYVTSTEQKLLNKEFTAKAPEQVIGQMKQKLMEAQEKHKVLTERLTHLSSV